MISKEQVKALCYEFSETLFGHEDTLIDNWFNEFQPEVKEVVGLSDSQIKQLTTHFICEKPDVDSPAECHAVISDYLKSQSFSPREVQQVYVGLSEEHIRAFTKAQFPEWAEHAFVNRILEWQKTQSFAQPDAEITNISPNWDNAPKWATWLAQDSDGQWLWYQDKPVRGDSHWERQDGCECECLGFIDNWQHSLQERPLPTPKVGESWKSNKDEVVIIAVNDHEVVCQKHNTKRFDIYSFKDFINIFNISKA